jgi:hypothetical protein
MITAVIPTTEPAITEMTRLPSSEEAIVCVTSAISRSIRAASGGGRSARASALQAREADEQEEGEERQRHDAQRRADEGTGDPEQRRRCLRYRLREVLGDVSGLVADVRACLQLLEHGVVREVLHVGGEVVGEPADLVPHGGRHPDHEYRGGGEKGDEDQERGLAAAHAATRQPADRGVEAERKDEREADREDHFAGDDDDVDRQRDQRRLEHGRGGDEDFHLRRASGSQGRRCLDVVRCGHPTSILTGRADAIRCLARPGLDRLANRVGTRLKTKCREHPGGARIGPRAGVRAGLLDLRD